MKKYKKRIPLSEQIRNHELQYSEQWHMTSLVGKTIAQI